MPSLARSLRIGAICGLVLVAAHAASAEVANLTSGAPGVVGVALEHDASGAIVIRALLPGGPAERSHVPVGGVLVAVDGKPVADTPADQVPALVKGAAGSYVTLSVRDNGTITDYVLQRVAAGAPADVNHPNPGPQVAPQGVGLLKPGLRVSYFIGEASLPGVRNVLVLDDQGNWVDPGTGQHYSSQEQQGAAGGAINQVTFVAADDRDLAADVRNYLLVDPAQGLTTISTVSAYKGTPADFGDLWQPPAKLDALAEGNANGQQVARMDYPIAGRTFHAVSITMTTPAGFSRTVFDRESGLMIAMSRSAIGAAQTTVGPNGVAGAGAGTTMLSTTRLLGTRQLNVPWLNRPLPAWLHEGAQLTFNGTYETRIDNTPSLPPSSAQCAFAFVAPHATWTMCKQTFRTQLPYGGNPPQVVEADRAFGSALSDGPWIDPQALAQLQPNAVIDDDPISKRRVTFLGTQNGVAVFEQRSALESTRSAYDLRSGVLVSIEQATRQAPATLVLKLRLANQP